MAEARGVKKVCECGWNFAMSEIFSKGACICFMNLNVWTYVFFHHVHHTMHFYLPVSECESYLLEISLNHE